MGAEPSDPEKPLAREERLHEIVEELLLALRAGERPAASELAQRFGLAVEEVERCVATAAALHAALGEDLPARRETEQPAPSLPSDYELLGELGRGGMGVVYRARQRSLDRVVAVKVLRPGEIVFGDALQRFQREARALAKLRHRHIVAIHEVGEAAGNVYYTMDLIEGSSLAELILRDQMTPARTVRILRQVSSAIAYAHSHGIIHRDLKPGNILIDREGEAYVADFGLARDLAATGTATSTGHMLGTPAYMSPEQALGDNARIGEPTDVYALGAILYECLAGRAPFAGMGLAEMVHAVIHDDPPALRRFNPRVPRELEVICQKAMSKEPERRYGTARALLEDLERFESGLPIRAERPRLGYRLRRFARRNWQQLLSAAGTAVILALFYFLVVMPTDPGDGPAFVESGHALHEEGKHDAAVSLYERALELPTSQDVVRAAQEGILRCDVDLALALGRAGKTGEALGLLERASDLKHEFVRRRPGSDDEAKLELSIRSLDIGWLVRAEYLTEIARHQARWGDLVNAGRSRMNARGAKRWAMGNEPMTYEARQRLETEIDALHGEGLYESLVPALKEPGDPGHRDAALVLASELLFADPERAKEWLASKGLAAVDCLTAVLTALEKVSERDRHLFLHSATELFTRICGTKLENELAALVENEHLSESARGLASEFLCIAADLPICEIQRAWSMPLSSESYAYQEAETRAGILDVWREIADAPRMDGFRRRVELAIDSLPAEGQGALWLRFWLVTHTGQDFDASVGAWRSWWEEHRGGDPRTWLAESLQLDLDSPGARQPALIERFLHAGPQSMEALRLHHLMGLLLDPTVRPPACRTDDRIPDSLAMSWCRLVPGAPIGTPYRLRIAELSVSQVDGLPTLEWQQRLPIRIGESVEVHHEEVGLLPESWRMEVSLVGAARHDAPGSTEGLRRFTTSASLAWDTVGLRLHLEETWIEYRGLGPRGRESGSNTWGPVERILVVGDLTQGLLGARDQRVPMVVAWVEPEEADASEWSVEGWRAAVLQSVRASALSAQVDAEYVAWHLGPATCWLPVPEAGAELERAVLEAHRQLAPGAETDRLLAPGVLGQLLAGHASVLAQPSGLELARAAIAQPFGGMLAGSGDEARWEPVDRPFAARLLLSTHEPAVRDLALEVLRDRVLSDDLVLALAEALGPRSAELPAWLGERIERERESGWLEWLEDRLSFPGIRLEFLWALVVDALGLGWSVLAVRAAAGSKRRLRYAAYALVAGVLIATVSLRGARFELMPDGLGFFLASLGAFLLLQGRGDRWSWVAASAWPVALLADSLATLQEGSNAFALLATGAGFLAVLGLPLLVRGVDSSAFAPEHLFRRMFLVVFVLFYGVLLGSSLLRGLSDAPDRSAAGLLAVIVGQEPDRPTMYAIVLLVMTSYVGVLALLVGAARRARPEPARVATPA